MCCHVILWDFKCWKFLSLEFVCLSIGVEMSRAWCKDMTWSLRGALALALALGCAPLSPPPHHPCETTHIHIPTRPNNVSHFPPIATATTNTTTYISALFSSLYFSSFHFWFKINLLLLFHDFFIPSFFLLLFPFPYSLGFLFNILFFCIFYFNLINILLASNSVLLVAILKIFISTLRNVIVLVNFTKTSFYILEKGIFFFNHLCNISYWDLLFTCMRNSEWVLDR